MATVNVFMPSRSGQTGHTLWLYKKSDFTLVNTGGDTLTETGSTGTFTAVVAESWTERLKATIKNGSGVAVWYGFIGVGQTEIVDSLSDTLTPSVQATTAGTASGAGTSTETFVGLEATAAVSADSSGNRSAVVIT